MVDAYHTGQSSFRIIHWKLVTMVTFLKSRTAGRKSKGSYFFIVFLLSSVLCACIITYSKHEQITFPKNIQIEILYSYKSKRHTCTGAKWD